MLMVFTACGGSSSNNGGTTTEANQTQETNEKNASNPINSSPSEETSNEETSNSELEESNTTGIEEEQNSNEVEENTPDTTDSTSSTEEENNDNSEEEQGNSGLDENNSNIIENSSPIEEENTDNPKEEEQNSDEVEENASNTTDSTSSTEAEINEEEKHFGKAQLGVLAKATVKLYELRGLERKLLASTITSEGNSIESIGNFNLYLEKLEDNKLYLYEVSGGEDFDVNDDGIIDDTPTQNKGTFHLLVLGSHLKVVKEAKITVISEVIYQKLVSSLELPVTNIVTLMESSIKEVIEKDINDDGFVGLEDMLKFDPIVDSSKLQERYTNNVPMIIQDILNNQTSDYTAPIFSNNEIHIQVNENITFVHTLHVVDDSNVSISLAGMDATQFTYNKETKELFFVSKADFETPLDSNGDNIFEVTLQAMDSYYNSATQALTIEVLDVNETIPEVPELEDSNFSIAENSDIGTLLGTISIKKVGTTAISSYILSGEDSKFFTVSNEGQLFAQESFDFESKKNYQFEIEALNRIGKSNIAQIDVNITNVPDIKPLVANVTLFVYENRPIGTVLGPLNIWEIGDSNITKYTLYGELDNDFKINLEGQVETLSYLNYESKKNYQFEYTAHNDAGESEKALLKIEVRNVHENSGTDYPKTEKGIQSALDNGDYSFVLTQLLNNRGNYSGLNDDEINMNIAAAYVGSSGYTVFDILGAMSDGNTSSFNDFVKNITEENNAVDTINKLKEADTYYSQIVQGLDCNDTSTLTEIQKNSCYNLGLVRLTSLTNSVKLLFGGEEETVEKWANGVTPNSSDDFNGNGVLDKTEASACAVVYANDPNDSCQDGTFYAYKGRIIFRNNGQSYPLTLLEVDVGNATNGYQSFYQFVSSSSNNNTPILTSGICDINFNKSAGPANGTTLFPCPTLNNSGEVMGIKENLEQSANVQSLFPDGDSTKTTIESYLTNITGSPDGTIGLDNLSTYLRSN
jgi:hypothetical protein